MDELIKNEISAWEIFENALQEKGFADKEVYLLACRDDTILGDMEKIVSDYTSSYTTADTRLKQLKYQTKDKVWVNILELEQIKSSLNETKRDVDNKKNTHLARANANKKNRQVYYQRLLLLENMGQNL